jgi:hypothetical protein
MDRLHPDTLRDLRQMILLHGANRLIAAIREIEASAPKGKIIRNVYNPPNHLVDEMSDWLERHEDELLRASGAPLDEAYASAEAFDAAQREGQPEPSPEDMDAVEDWEQTARERRP